MQTVIIESKFRATEEWKEDENRQFAIDVCRFATRLGYAPFASHLFYPQYLNDANPSERHLGISSGYAWGVHADEYWFCFRSGEDFSDGMGLAHEHYLANGKSGALVKEISFSSLGEFKRVLDVQRIP